MSITYFAEAVVLGGQGVTDAIGEDEDLMLGIKTPSNTSEATFDVFMDINYIYAKADSQYWDNEISDEDFQAIHNYYLNWTFNAGNTAAWSRMGVFRDNNKEKFDAYKTGMTFYNNFENDDWWWETKVLGTNQKFFTDMYDKFILAGGSNNTYQKYVLPAENFSIIKSILGDSADKAVSSFVSGIGKFIELISFDVKNGAGATAIPTEVRAVLLIFFIPMWALVLIELASLATQIVQAVKFW
jgi:hypothetical protein